MYTTYICFACLKALIIARVCVESLSSLARLNEADNVNQSGFKRLFSYSLFIHAGIRRFKETTDRIGFVHPSPKKAKIATLMPFMITC